MFPLRKTMSDFWYGCKRGIPIALGYLSVSFTFGVKAVHGGMPIWTAVLMSFTNLTSAGQFAGTNLMLAGGTYIELAVSTLVINLRYMLMSLSLSQKLSGSVKRKSCLLFGYGITDEIFAVASGELRPLTASYMYGLISTPVIGWTAGTLLGGVASGIMPEILANAMELGLYAMFIAIIIPPARKSRAVVFVITLAILVECLLYYLPVFSRISSGFQVILATVAAAAAGAFLFPVSRENDETERKDGEAAK